MSEADDMSKADMSEPITIRYSSRADADRVRRLAELDGGRAPEGRALLAEVGGRLWAAVGLADGVAVADPFLPSAEVLELLKLRVEQDRERALGRGPLLGRLMLVRQREGVIA